MADFKQSPLDHERAVREQLLKQAVSVYAPDTDKRGLRLGDIPGTVFTLMSWVEQFKHLRGCQKKQVVLDTLKGLIHYLDHRQQSQPLESDESDDSDSESWVGIRSAAMRMIPAIVDWMMVADKQGIRMREVPLPKGCKTCTSGCMSACMPGNSKGVPKVPKSKKSATTSRSKVVK